MGVCCRPLTTKGSAWPQSTRVEMNRATCLLTPKSLRVTAVRGCASCGAPWWPREDLARRKRQFFCLELYVTCNTTHPMTTLRRGRHVRCLEFGEGVVGDVHQTRYTLVKGCPEVAFREMPRRPSLCFAYKGIQRGLYSALPHSGSSLFLFPSCQVNGCRIIVALNADAAWSCNIIYVNVLWYGDH